MDDTMRSCREFTAVLSSAAPAPGGGGAAALTAAVGTALCGMVANLTTGKKAYSAVESDIQQLLSTTNALQEKLLDQVAADAEGDRKSTRLNSSHLEQSRMPSSA